MNWLGMMVWALWDTAVKMSPWLLFGFLAAGVLSLFFTPEFVSRHLGRKAGAKAVFLSVLLGVPLPLCSCGVLPVAAGLRRGGAGKGATAAFLISTPQTGIDSICATGSLLGPVFALFRPLVATISGLLGGWLINLADTDPVPEAQTARSVAGKAAPWYKKLWTAVRYGFVTLFGSVAPALLVGLLLSAGILAFVPASFFEESFLGNDWIAFPVMLLIGMPMYVCSTASIPVALALMAKGISPGAALIFLIVGPALNGASLTTLLRLLGRTCTAIYLAVISGVALVSGLALNLIEARWNVLPPYAENTCIACAEGHGGPLVGTALAVVLFALLAFHLIVKPIVRRHAFEHHEAPSVAGTRITVEGMRCDHCRNAVRRLLVGYPEVTSVTLLPPTDFAIVGTLPASLEKDIADIGFVLKVAVPVGAPAVQRLTVTGMRCDHCRNSVRRLLEGYEGVKQVEVIPPTDFAVTGSLPGTLKADIAQLGFELTADVPAVPIVKRITVGGMRCDHCRNSVRRLLEGYEGVTQVEVIPPTDFAVTGSLPDTLKADIAQLGFELRG